MTQIKKILCNHGGLLIASITAASMGCGSVYHGDPAKKSSLNGTSESDVDLSKTHNLSGAQAELLLSLMFQTGIRDASGRLGAMHLNSDRIDCSAPVVVNPVASCTIETATKTKVVDQGVAQQLFTLLRESNATVKSDRLGITQVEAQQVDCQRTTIRGGGTVCSFID